MTDHIIKTIAFVKEQFEQSEVLQNKNYRFDHTIRVASIGQQIAIAEGLDEEALILGCLLHDISYNSLNSDEDWENHGRTSAKIAHDFLMSLGIDKNRIEEICYGIAIHVDDEAGYEGKKTPLAVSVGDADNIDRFDVERIYEGLKHINFDLLSKDEQLQHIEKVLNNSEKHLKVEFGTKTATMLFHQKVEFRILFYKQLETQIKQTII